MKIQSGIQPRLGREDGSDVEKILAIGKPNEVSQTTTTFFVVTHLDSNGRTAGHCKVNFSLEKAAVVPLLFDD